MCSMLKQRGGVQHVESREVCVQHVEAERCVCSMLKQRGVCACSMLKQRGVCAAC